MRAAWPGSPRACLQIGPLTAWTHLTGFAYSSGGTLTPPEWAATPPPPFWDSDPLNLRDAGKACPTEYACPLMFSA